MEYINVLKGNGEEANYIETRDNVHKKNIKRKGKSYGEWKFNNISFYI